MAHSPNEAFFEIYEQDGQLVLYAEFPWTIRKVLLERYPELEQATTQQELEDGLLTYLRETIKVIAINDQPLELVSLAPLNQSEAHSHSATYSITFSHNAMIKQLTNNTMFERYQKQVNYHTITFNKKTWKGETTIKSPTLLLEELSPAQSKWLWGIPLGIILLLGAFLMQKNRVSKAA